jgi:hypothetical protein
MFICKYDYEKEITMEEFMDPQAFTPEVFHQIFRNDNYLNALKTWLPFLHKRGFLDPVIESEE